MTHNPPLVGAARAAHPPQAADGGASAPSLAKSISRRSVMNALVSVASVAAAAVPVTLAEANPEAELVALGRQFEELYLQWLPAIDEDNRVGWEAHALARGLAGITGEMKHTPQDQIDRFLTELGRIEDETGRNELGDRWQDLARQMDPIAEKIMALPVSTLAGLRAQTLVAFYTNGYLWCRPVEKLDYHEVGARRLIEATCSLVGLAAPVETPEVPDVADPAKVAEIEAARLAERPAQAPMDPVRFAILEAYNEWLFYERRMLCAEMYPEVDRKVAEKWVPLTWGDSFHFPAWRPGGKNSAETPPPSTRAGLVLTAVGIDLDATPPVPRMRNADAELIRLGQKFEKLQREIDQLQALPPAALSKKQYRRLDRLCDRHMSTAIEIFGCEARGLAGLAVQARAFETETEDERKAEAGGGGRLDFCTIGNTVAQGVLRLAS